MVFQAALAAEVLTAEVLVVLQLLGKEVPEVMEIVQTALPLAVVGLVRQQPMYRVQRQQMAVLVLNG
jgi:hypothetical protein